MGLVAFVLSTNSVFSETDMYAYGMSLVNKHREMTSRLQEIIPPLSPAEQKWLDDEFEAAKRLRDSEQFEASTNRILRVAKSREYLTRGLKQMLSELSQAFQVLASEGRTKIDEAWALSKIITIFSGATTDVDIVLRKAVEDGLVSKDVAEFMAHADSSQSARYGYGTRWAEDSYTILHFTLEPMLAEMRKSEPRQPPTTLPKG